MLICRLILSRLLSTELVFSQSSLLSSTSSCHPHSAITTSSGPLIVAEKVGLLLSQVCITPYYQTGCLTCHPTLQKFHFAQSIGATALCFYCRGNSVSPAVESLQPTPKTNRFYPLTSSFRWFVSLLSCKAPSITILPSACCPVFIQEKISPSVL